MIRTADTQSPPELARALDEIGAAWNDDIVGNRQRVLDLYRPLLTTAPVAGRVVRNIAYGADSAQRLDVFGPDRKCAGSCGRPVVVFVHGGGFTRGKKSDGLVYDNVLHWFSRQGFVGVNVEYRLAPGARYPAGAHDVSAALDWVAANITQHDGDPARVLVIGHSAGGSHVATAFYNRELGLWDHPGVRGTVLISARLRADMRPDNPNADNVRAYYGPDSEFQDRNSPVQFAGTSSLPVMLAVAEHENRYLDMYADEFAAVHAARTGRRPRLLRVPRHNHTSIVAHFNTNEDMLGQEILHFARQDCGLTSCSFCMRGKLAP